MEQLEHKVGFQAFAGEEKSVGFFADRVLPIDRKKKGVLPRWQKSHTRSGGEKTGLSPTLGFQQVGRVELREVLLEKKEKSGHFSFASGFRSATVPFWREVQQF